MTWQFKPFQSVGYSSNILLSPSVLAMPNGDTMGRKEIYNNDYYHKIGFANRVAKTRPNGEVIVINTNVQTQNYLQFRLADSAIVNKIAKRKFFKRWEK
jgi:hypothetical protein